MFYFYYRLFRNLNSCCIWRHVEFSEDIVTADSTLNSKMDVLILEEYLGVCFDLLYSYSIKASINKYCFIFILGYTEIYIAVLFEDMLKFLKILLNLPARCKVRWMYWLWKNGLLYVLIHYVQIPSKLGSITIVFVLFQVTQKFKIAVLLEDMLNFSRYSYNWQHFAKKDGCFPPLLSKLVLLQVSKQQDYQSIFNKRTMSWVGKRFLQYVFCDQICHLTWFHWKATCIESCSSD